MQVALADESGQMARLELQGTIESRTLCFQGTEAPMRQGESEPGCSTGAGQCCRTLQQRPGIVWVARAQCVDGGARQRSRIDWLFGHAERSPSKRLPDPIEYASR